MDSLFLTARGRGREGGGGEGKKDAFSCRTRGHSHALTYATKCAHAGCAFLQSRARTSNERTKGEKERQREKREREGGRERGRARARHSPRFRAFSRARGGGSIVSTASVRPFPVGTGLPCGVVKDNGGDVWGRTPDGASFCVDADACNTTQRQRRSRARVPRSWCTHDSVPRSSRLLARAGTRANVVGRRSGPKGADRRSASPKLSEYAQLASRGRSSNSNSLNQRNGGDAGRTESETDRQTDKESANEHARTAPRRVVRRLVASAVLEAVAVARIFLDDERILIQLRGALRRHCAGAA